MQRQWMTMPSCVDECSTLLVFVLPESQVATEWPKQDGNPFLPG
jgi:hypothetical protein